MGFDPIQLIWYKGDYRQPEGWLREGWPASRVAQALDMAEGTVFRIKRRFGIQDARTKLHRLYPINS